MAETDSGEVDAISWMEMALALLRARDYAGPIPSGPCWKLSDELKKRIGYGKPLNFNSFRMEVLKVSGASVQLRLSLCDETEQLLSVDLPYIDQGNNLILLELDKAAKVQIT